MKNKNGISLIVLIITIIVVIILAAAVILTLSKNNPIESAKEATFKEDIRSYQDELNMYISKEYQMLAGQRDSKITATGYEKDSTSEEYNNSVYKYLSSFKKKYENKLAIKEDMIVYVGTDEKEKAWLVNSGVYIAKQFTIRYINEYGEELCPSEEIAQIDAEYTYYAKEIDGYLPIEEEISGIASSDTNITFEYCKICNDLAFKGLDANGNETEDESNIVSYTVSGIGNCTDTWIAFPKIHNGKDVIQIKRGAFYSNKKIKKIVIPSTIKKVGYDCFERSSVETLNLNAIQLESSDNFEYTPLQKVIIGKNVENIGGRAFYGCYNLTDVKILTDKANFNAGVFLGCSKLKEIKINEDNSKYKVEDGVLYSKDGKTIYLYPPAKDGNFKIPSTVEELGGGAFYRNYYLTEINIPNTVKKVGGGCFAGCSKLESATINTETIGDSCFTECGKLDNVNINAKILDGWDHFRSISGKNVVFGKNVEKLGSRPFYGCNSITQVSFLGTIAEWNNIANKNNIKSGSSITKVICTDGEINL